jgi:hypothetical protein
METETATAIVLVEQLTPMQLFAPGAMRPLLDRIKAEVRAIDTDISTETGRKAVNALVAHGIDATSALCMIGLIDAGEVPNVTISY